MESLRNLIIGVLALFALYVLSRPRRRPGRGEPHRFAPPWRHRAGRSRRRISFRR